jgi:hypothetical protein
MLKIFNNAILAMSWLFEKLPVMMMNTENQVVSLTRRSDSSTQLYDATGAEAKIDTSPTSVPTSPTPLIDTLVTIPRPPPVVGAIEQATIIDDLELSLEREMRQRCFHYAIGMACSFTVGSGIGAIITFLATY